MVIKFSITFRKHFDNARTIINFFVAFSLAPFFYAYIDGHSNYSEYIPVCILMFSVFFIPQLILHIRYYVLNKGRILYFYADRQKYSLVLKDGRTFDFFESDIALLELTQTPPFAERRMRWSPWDNYNYFFIHLKNGQRFFISSLLVLRLDVPLEDGRVKLRKPLYCFPLRVREVFDVKEDSASVD